MFKMKIVDGADRKFFAIMFSREPSKLLNGFAAFFTIDAKGLAHWTTKVGDERSKVYVKPWGKPTKLYN